MTTSSASHIQSIYKRIFSILGNTWERRRGPLGPAVVFMTIIEMCVMGSTSYRRALAEIKRRLGRSFGPHKIPTASAVTQGRAKFTNEVCDALSRHVMSMSQKAAVYPEYAYKDYRLLSFDGTTCHLPTSAELLDHFGKRNNQGEIEVPSVGIVVLWNIGTHQPVGWQLESANMSERDGARSLFKHLGKKDLVVTQTVDIQLWVFFMNYNNRVLTISYAWTPLR